MANSSARQRTGFTFYRSFSDAIRLLSSRDQLALYNAIADYALDQRLPDIDKFSKTARICWVTILPNLVTGVEGFRNGCKGGAPKGNSNARKTPAEQPQNNLPLNTETNNGNGNEDDNADEDAERVSVQDMPADTLAPDTVHDSIHDSIHETSSVKSTSKSPSKSSSKSASEKSRRFTPPSVDEVSDYISSRGLAADAAQFVDYYTANGWHVGRSPMRDWQAALRNWARRDTGTAAFSLSLKIADNETRPLYQAL